MIKSVPRREIAIPRRETAIPRRGIAISRRGMRFLISFSGFVSYMEAVCDLPVWNFAQRLREQAAVCLSRQPGEKSLASPVASQIIKHKKSGATRAV